LTVITGKTIINMKDTRVIFRANGGSWRLTMNGSSYRRISGDESFECTGSNSGGVDVVGEFYNDRVVLQIEVNNPWIGSPWAAIGQVIDDMGGWSNGRTELSEGEYHIFSTTFYTDDDEYVFNTRVIRLMDTDTKNFEIYPDWNQ
jgi:hypothetical protein